MSKLKCKIVIETDHKNMHNITMTGTNVDMLYSILDATVIIMERNRKGISKSEHEKNKLKYLATLQKRMEKINKNNIS